MTEKQRKLHNLILSAVQINQMTFDGFMNVVKELEISYKENALLVYSENNNASNPLDDVI